MFDISPYLNPADPWPGQGEPMSIIQRLYSEKYNLASILRPNSILEIGVRCGYSAAAFLAACPTARYLGIDHGVPGDKHGGLDGALDFARQMLAEKFPSAQARIEVADTQQMSALPGGSVDLVYIDGDHSYSGCRHDLHLAAALRPRYVLVDDVTYLPLVRHAVEEFCVGRRFLRLDTVRGDVLIHLEEV
jgi:hypothetical protein